MNLNEILTDLFLDANDFRDAHAVPMGDRLRSVGVDPQQATELEHIWQDALGTHRDTLLRLQAGGHGADAPSGNDHASKRVPTQAELAQLDDERLVEAIIACEASLKGCRHALTLLDGRETGAQADAWLGDDAPAESFRQLAGWLEAALVVLRRLRQWRALADHRTPTQFQPLDPASPTVLVQVRMPQNLVERLDAALDGRSRSDAIREAISGWLDAESAGQRALVRRQPSEEA